MPTNLEKAIADAKKTVRTYSFLRRLGGWFFTALCVVAPVFVLALIAILRGPPADPVADRDLAPYRLIHETDLTKLERLSPDAKDHRQDLLGRILLKTVKKGEPIESSAVGSLSGTLVMSIPIKPLPKGLAAGLPAKAALLGEPKTGQTVHFQSVVTILTVDDSKDVWATIALEMKDRDALLQAITVCDFYVVLDPSRN